jgi:hypothetical protein
LGIDLILRKRRDAFEWLTIASTPPVLLEFGAVQLRPLANEPQRTVGQGAGEDLE